VTLGALGGEADDALEDERALEDEALEDEGETIPHTPHISVRPPARAVPDRRAREERAPASGNQLADS
jgi:hypothetical protein